MGLSRRIDNGGSVEQACSPPACGCCRSCWSTERPSRSTGLGHSASPPRRPRSSTAEPHRVGCPSSAGRGPTHVPPAPPLTLHADIPQASCHGLPCPRPVPRPLCSKFLHHWLLASLQPPPPYSPGHLPPILWSPQVAFGPSLVSGSLTVFPHRQTVSHFREPRSPAAPSAWCGWLSSVLLELINEQMENWSPCVQRPVYRLRPPAAVGLGGGLGGWPCPGTGAGVPPGR